MRTYRDPEEEEQDTSDNDYPGFDLDDPIVKGDQDLPDIK